MSNTIPTKRFKRDIELVKLQAKIADYQTGYYSGMTFAFTTAIGVFVAMVALAVETRYPPFFIGGLSILVVIFIFIFWYGERTRKSNVAQIRRDIESIYNEEPIKY